jgi:acyl transferase domain-containing protein
LHTAAAAAVCRASRLNVIRSERTPVHNDRIAVMFAGQGKLDRAVVAPAGAAGVAGPSDAGGARRLALEVYAASVAAYRRLESTGFAPHVVIGHGFGEIAAMVAAGAFTPAEGADIVAARCGVLEREAAGRYGMAAIQASPRTVATLLSLVRAAGLSVAAENSSRQSVVVGPPSAVWAVADLAAALDIAVVPLKAPWAPHRVRDDSREAFASKLRHLVQRPLERAVFSPLKGRVYRDSDVLIACLADQLAAPIRFGDAVARLVADGVSLIVECGPLRGLGASLDCRTIEDTTFCRMSAQEVA